MVSNGSTGIAYTTGASFAPATNRLAKINNPITDPTTMSSRAIRRRSSSAIRPLIRAAVETNVRNPTATQNNRSDVHQPVIRSVAMTAVAHPLRIAATAVATAGLRGGRRVPFDRNRPGPGM